MLPRLTAALLTILLVCLAGNISAQENTDSAELTPNLNPNIYEKPQPFAGEVEFVKAAGYRQACTVGVALTCLATLPDSQTLYFEMLDPYDLEILPEEFVWPGPIDSGATLATQFTFMPREVGRFEFLLTRKLGEWRQTLARLALALNEDGEVVYAGRADGCHVTAVRPHPWRGADTLRLHFDHRESGGLAPGEGDFSAVFKLSPAPAPNVTTNVDLFLRCHAPFYNNVQFQLEFSSVLQPSALPESWGQNVGPNPRFSDHKCVFSFKALAPGMGILKFKVVGTRPGVKFGDTQTTTFPIYYVLGRDGKLKYIGYENPWERFSSEDDPMLGSLTDLLDHKYDRHQFKQISSEPDYLRMKAQADSAGTNK